MPVVLNRVGIVLSKVWKAISGDGKKRMSTYEQYLHESTDVHDLEAREREWNRRMQNRQFL